MQDTLSLSSQESFIIGFAGIQVVFCHRFTGTQQTEHNVRNSLFFNLLAVSDIAHEEVLNDSCKAQSLLFGIGRSLFVKLRVNSYFHNCMI